MKRAFVIGGTRFIGRHTVADLLDHDYRVTLFTRGEHDDPFADREGVHHVQGDRTDDRELLSAAREVDPDVVFDFVAYRPREVDTATDVFADVDAYVYVSSGAVYGREDVPKREGVTPLKDCTAEQATDDSRETYGNRKAAGDRTVFEAARQGVNAMSVRPTVVYGPHDYTERFDYWIHRVNEHDRILLPGDGTNLWQFAYVEDVARALRIVAEEGDPGEAYNVGARNAVTLERSVDLIAEALETDVEVVHASDRELSIAGLSLREFPLYRPSPHLLATEKLAGLGWDATAAEDAVARTVEEHLESDRTGADEGPSRADEERVLEVLETL